MMACHSIIVAERVLGELGESAIMHTPSWNGTSLHIDTGPQLLIFVLVVVTHHSTSVY